MRGQSRSLTRRCRRSYRAWIMLTCIHGSGEIDTPKTVDGPGGRGTCRGASIPELGLEKGAAWVVEAAGWGCRGACAAEAGVAGAGL
jgi:hypothetical protein